MSTVRHNQGRLLTVVPAVSVNGNAYLLRVHAATSTSSPLEIEDGLVLDVWPIRFGRAVGPLTLGSSFDEITDKLGQPTFLASHEVFYGESGLVLAFRHAVLQNVHVLVGRNSQREHNVGFRVESLIRKQPLMPLDNLLRVAGCFGKPVAHPLIGEEGELRLAYSRIGLSFDVTNKKGTVTALDIYPTASANQLDMKVTAEAIV